MTNRKYDFIPVKYASGYIVLSDGSRLLRMQFPTYLSDIPGGFFIDDIDSFLETTDNNGESVIVIKMKDVGNSPGHRTALHGTKEDFCHNIERLKLDFADYQVLFK